jgi:serine/threonine-protein kinase
MSEGARRALAYQVFSQALDLKAKSRERFLDEQCRDDAVLRCEVEGLLQVSANDCLETGALRGLPAAPEESLIGQTLGRFRLVERVGEGGMGVVYRAERTDGVRQSVAVKVVSSMLAGAAQQRFEREAQLLARLEHPAIARLIDAGIAESRAWIAIEFVRGQRIDEFCAARRLPAREIVRLLILLADAVQAAHRMLVVHSDIKPANVLVNSDGLPKLVDFGISSALRDAGAAGTADSPTVSLGRLFSPNYAAPEQITGGSLTVATDVFGLGALAYRLLTGVSPYADASSPISYLLAVTQRDVELPSRAAQAAGRTQPEVHALRGDLDAVLSKALERNPGRRYPTAADMQADLKRYLDDRPVAARTPSTAYRMGKFLRRNALATGLAGLLIISLLAGGVVAAIQARRAAMQAQQTAIARNMAARRGEFLENLLKSADPRAGRRDVSVAELLDSATAALDDKLAGEPLVEASMLGLIVDTYDGLGRYPQALAASDRQLALVREHGGSALEVGRALLSRGEVLRELGQWPQAEPVVREAVALLQPLRAPAELAAGLDLLGIVLAHNHHEREAETTYLEEIYLELRGDRELHKRLSLAYYALAGLYLDAGREAEALNLGRKALDLARQFLPPDHPDLLAVELQFASTLVTNRRPVEAEPLIRDVVIRNTRVSGAGHKDTLNSQWVLADDLIELHRDAEAAAIALPAAQGLEALLGADNTYTLTAWQTYAVAACNNGEESAGLPIARRVESARRRLSPPTDRLLHMASTALGSCLLRSHRYAEAESVLLAAAAGLEAARGPQYRRTQDAYRNLRDLYFAAGRPRDAAVFAAKLRQ